MKEEHSILCGAFTPLSRAIITGATNSIDVFVYTKYPRQAKKIPTKKMENNSRAFSCFFFMNIILHRFFISRLSHDTLQLFNFYATFYSSLLLLLGVFFVVFSGGWCVCKMFVWLLKAQKHIDCLYMAVFIVIVDGKRTNEKAKTKLMHRFFCSFAFVY